MEHILHNKTWDVEKARLRHVHRASGERSKLVIVDGWHKPIAALVKEFDDRQDATALMDTMHTPYEEVHEIKQKLGMNDLELTEALNKIFGVKGTIRYVPNS